MIRFHLAQPISGRLAALVLAAVLVAVHGAATAPRAHAGTFDHWIQMPGKATDIAAGSDPAFQTDGNGGANNDLQVWVAGIWQVYVGVVEQALAGYTTYQATCSGICNLLDYNWKQTPAVAVRLALGRNAQPWLVNNFGEVWTIWAGDVNWAQVPGVTASDIGAGADGSVWVTGTDRILGGHSIYRFVCPPLPNSPYIRCIQGYWERVDGGATRIAVGPNGDPWVVNEFGNIFHRNNIIGQLGRLQ